jgi:putative colanic acid biosynthesis UDP-glucose lipid carrier transferase
LRDYEDVVHALQRVLDIFWIVLAHIAMCAVYGQAWRREMSNATVMGIVVFSVAAELCGLYRPWRSEGLTTEIRAALLVWLSTIAALVLAAAATKTTALYSRVVTFGWFAAAPVILAGWRIAGRLILRAARSNGINIKTVALVGATAGAERLYSQIKSRPWLGMKVRGIYDDRMVERHHVFTDAGPPFVGRVAELIADCRANRINMVYVALPLRAEARIAELLRALADTTASVYLVADFFTYDLLCAHWSAIGNSPLVSIRDTPFRGVYGWLKWLEDVVIGALIMTVISLPLLVIAAAIKATSPGPIFFRQRRYGLNGKEIRVLKFRTMTVCEDGPVVAQAQRNDPRVTPLGRFLRRLSLDELPQFIQVMTGEMSIVGPRPHAVAHNEQYRSLIHGYMLRHKVKPGITGWAQVNGWRGETPDITWMEKRVQHDLEYIENWSLVWDIKIILMTILGRKKNQNAY